jgi:thioredoxin 1
MGKVIDVTDSTFNEVINSTEGIVLVDFWAAWCGPCRMLGPVLDAVAKENEDITVAKVDIMTNKQIAAQFGIRNIPAVHIYKNGEKVSQFVGAQPKANIEKIVSEWR